MFVISATGKDELLPIGVVIHADAPVSVPIEVALAAIEAGLAVAAEQPELAP